MKLRILRKLMISALSLTGLFGLATPIISNNLNVQNNSLVTKAEENLHISKMEKSNTSPQKIDNLAELETYLPGISTGIELTLKNGEKITQTDGWRYLDRVSGDQALFSMEEIGNGNFYLRGSNGGYARAQKGTPSVVFNGINVQELDSENGDEFEVWLYKEEILFIPKVKNTFSDLIQGNYWDIEYGEPQYLWPVPKTASFPTEDELDNWNFNVKISSNRNKSELIENSFQSPQVLNYEEAEIMMPGITQNDGVHLEYTSEEKFIEVNDIRLLGGGSTEPTSPVKFRLDNSHAVSDPINEYRLKISEFEEDETHIGQGIRSFYAEGGISRAGTMFSHPIGGYNEDDCTLVLHKGRLLVLSKHNHAEGHIGNYFDLIISSDRKDIVPRDHGPNFPSEEILDNWGFEISYPMTHENIETSNITNSEATVTSTFTNGTGTSGEINFAELKYVPTDGGEENKADLTFFDKDNGIATWDLTGLDPTTSYDIYVEYFSDETTSLGSYSGTSFTTLDRMLEIGSLETKWVDSGLEISINGFTNGSGSQKAEKYIMTLTNNNDSNDVEIHESSIISDDPISHVFQNVNKDNKYEIEIVYLNSSNEEIGSSVQTVRYNVINIVLIISIFVPAGLVAIFGIFIWKIDAK